jgi:Tfp pilus assembly protein PilF
MRPTVRSLQRLASGILLLALPFGLSYCAGNQTTVRSLKPDELSRIQAMHDPWPNQKSTIPEPVPDSRLEILGDMALQNRNFESSLINYLQVLREHPDRYDLHYKVGVAFLMSKNFDAAQKELALVLVHCPQMLKAHEALGLVFLQSKQYPQAIDEFQYVLNQDPRRSLAHHLLGVTYLEAGWPERAIGELQKATRQNPRHLSSFIVLGQAYLRQKDYVHATASLKHAKALAPKNPKVNRLLGEALAGQKKYAQALTAFLEAGDEAQAYNNIGVYYFTDGQYEEAAKCFQHAIEIRPTFYQEAKSNLQRALEKLQQSRLDGS